MNDTFVGKSDRDVCLHARHGHGRVVYGGRRGMLDAMAKLAAVNAGRQLGRSILRGVLGSILKK